MAFHKFIVTEYKIWSADKLGQDASEAAFGRWLGPVSQRVISSWLHNGRVPDTWRHVQALIKRYGDKARVALGIDTEFVFVDHLPPRLERLLRLAVDEVNFELTRRGLDADTSEAEQITIEIFEKYGFNKTVKS